ncbi:sodium-coupled neutral amino acid transporter 9 homolog [Physella acuta]|uniref:sodium-coupled neutral amino acid transporter 9 homolog n=1 Tax=Physella acuta TaxID=109671 RepID=UPI0027DD8096|nr:sodium-coupled neutral amino acid transporter 9 homolog [Physella acuta]XP_059162512.1 sodium-coupled neutral amino acid transporter 9 homolog [Physella acuta]XP_059162513.1 sodium-coupled neutral amino acid transporter 9 homolog [Physella acuta]XP_059162515.1 sodium-coupled neutral amino acid transporter 9 homolog [Physella acuta]
MYNSVRTGQPNLIVNDDVESDDETSSLLGEAQHRIHDSSYSQIQGESGPPLVKIEHTSHVLEVDGNRSQHSIITIFSMWNTMMGTSLLSMPWTIKQAGFINGIILLVIMAGIMAYTSYRVLVAGRTVRVGILVEFSEAVRYYLGHVTEVIALLCSILTLIGGCIVYWILMSNFLYHIGVFIYSSTHTDPQHHNKTGASTFFGSASDVTCDNQTEIISFQNDLFGKVWDETKTVPLFLIVLVFPLINFKSPTFFTKFNSLGTLSVAYLTTFVVVKAVFWGVNLDLNTEHIGSVHYSTVFEWSFPALTGIAALAYLLQNAVISIVRNQKHPENNTRDLLIAYALVCITYTVVGAVFYATFPLHKSCIEDNFLNNIVSTDLMAFFARIGLFLQMMCVLPLLTYIIRAQLLHFIFHSAWPSLKHVLGLNVLIVCVCLVFAVFLPSIGHIISFVGGFCGFSYAIALPCAVYMMASYRDGNLTVVKVCLHGFLILIGFTNFIAQFIIIGHTK